ncbi:hypothetical protein X566_19045 [Afipia sp. P52-10]|uniref:hypothetical protein n=1 Tax=Afipia sp. P52-10 TaxID=1429916 RepID=UPI0003DF0A40|nr:hypothetical protein [Afipia sp. P52-10]ETR75864.1 hypothetical protein X566_19045 [Afipia sp. P52-10]
MLSVVADCAPVWDPRDPAQSRANPSTWQISYNPILHLIDYITEPDGGLGLEYETVIEPVLNAWMAEADLCDERVATASGGTEPRYTSNGWYQFDNEPKDVINAILATCDGWLAEAGDGTLAVKVGVYREPTVTLTQNEIFDFSLSYGQPDEQAVN